MIYECICCLSIASATLRFLILKLGIVFHPLNFCGGVTCLSIMFLHLRIGERVKCRSLKHECFFHAYNIAALFLSLAFLTLVCINIPIHESIVKDTSWSNHSTILLLIFSLPKHLNEVFQVKTKLSVYRRKLHV